LRCGGAGLEDGFGLKKIASPVGAGLPANFGVKECPLAGTIRLQASSYKDKLPSA
jgi:hypothetical protein